MQLLHVCLMNADSLNPHLLFLSTLSCFTPLQLLHVCLMNADSLNPIVQRDSQQLLVYLLYSLSLKHLEAAQVWGYLSRI